LWMGAPVERPLGRVAEEGLVFWGVRVGEYRRTTGRKKRNCPLGKGHRDQRRFRRRIGACEEKGTN